LNRRLAQPGIEQALCPRAIFPGLFNGEKFSPELMRVEKDIMFLLSGGVWEKRNMFLNHGS